MKDYTYSYLEAWEKDYIFTKDTFGDVLKFMKIFSGLYEKSFHIYHNDFMGEWVILIKFLPYFEGAVYVGKVRII